MDQLVADMKNSEKLKNVRTIDSRVKKFADLLRKHRMLDVLDSFFKSNTVMKVKDKSRPGSEKEVLAGKPEELQAVFDKVKELTKEE